MSSKHPCVVLRHAGRIQNQQNQCAQTLLCIQWVLIYFSLTVKLATLILIPGRGSAISSAKEGKAGSIYNLVENK